MEFSDKEGRDFYDKMENLRLEVSLSNCGLMLKKAIYRKINEFENIYDSRKRINRALRN